MSDIYKKDQYSLRCNIWHTGIFSLFAILKTKGLKNMLIPIASRQVRKTLKEESCQDTWKRGKKNSLTSYSKKYLTKFCLPKRKFIHLHIHVHVSTNTNTLTYTETSDIKANIRDKTRGRWNSLSKNKTFTLPLYFEGTLPNIFKSMMFSNFFFLALFTSNPHQ